MNLSTIIIIVAGVVLVMAVMAWLLYRANFRAKEITVKTGVVEAKLERKEAPASETPPAEAPAPRTEASQQALDGGRIDRSSIKAPAGSGASIEQKAKGKDSTISDSSIELN